LPLSRPTLLVIIDAEEEFDWRTIPPQVSGIRAMSHQARAQRIFERFGCVPTYAVDYSIASQREGYAPLLEMLEAGRCSIGAQVHPWHNPPLEEELCVRNSYPGNPPRELERAKLRWVTDTIEANLGIRPTLYRAGRYGLGLNTAALQLGYKIDCSVRPFFPSIGDGRPDYRTASNFPFWLHDDRNILEIPVTVGLTGHLRHFRNLLIPLELPSLKLLRIGGILALGNLIDRHQPSPEGTTIADAQRLTRSMIADGHRLFVMSYHSPSLLPGNTPYVLTTADLRLDWIERYFEFFLGEVRGCLSTPDLIYEAAMAEREYQQTVPAMIQADAAQ
jgi:hypothetical protein